MQTENIHHNGSLIAKLASHHRARIIITLVLLILLLIMAEAVSADDAKPGMKRATLLENKVDLPSNKINAKVLRVTFPAGFKTPWHTHEGPGPRYVVNGTLKVSEDGKEATYSSGETFWESGRKMQVENIGTDAAELVIFEMAPGDK